MHCELTRNTLINTTITSQIVGTYRTYIIDSFDKSIQCDIDPHLNYPNNVLKNQNITKALHPMKHLDKNIEFCTHNLNIRSVQLHFTEFMFYLDTLDIDFKIKALSETAINSSYINYNKPIFNMEINFRKKGGCVSLYI